jgi:hypothetical protein
LILAAGSAQDKNRTLKISQGCGTQRRFSELWRGHPPEKGCPSALTLFPIPELDQFAVPLWPRIPANFMWPPEVVLKTVEEFRAFADRWSRLNIFSITGGH